MDFTKSFLVTGIAAAAVAMALPASATVTGASSITITNAFGTYLQVGEVVATQAITGLDVAATVNGGSASALNNYPGSGGPGAAIDSDLGTNYYGPNGIYHSAGGASDFLTVNFANPSDLASLTIYGRTDCCQDRDLFNYSIFDAAGGLLAQGQLDGRTSPDGSATGLFPGGVPEPSTWALMLVGFGGLGVALRGRRKLALATA